MKNVLHCIETSTDSKTNYSSSFIIEPLQTGQGITLGNAIRRTLLLDLAGFSITGIRINNLKHEFSMIEGIREDILEIILNLKEISIKSSFLSKSSAVKLKGFLKTTGPCIVTAGMFYLPKNRLKILNPEQYICTITDNSEFYLEIDIENGVGYQLTEELQDRDASEKFDVAKAKTLKIDANFMPIKNVNYKIKLIHDTQGNIKESLHLDITTNGTITPKRSLQEGLKILINLFSSLFITPQFLSISKFYEFS